MCRLKNSCIYKWNTLNKRNNKKFQKIYILKILKIIIERIDVIGFVEKITQKKPLDCKFRCTSLDDVVSLFNQITLPNSYQRIEILVQEPLFLRKECTQGYSDVSDVENPKLAQAMASYHLHQGDFFSSVDQEQSFTNPLYLFTHSSIERAYKLKKGEVMVIQHPTIFLTSEHKIGFAVLYDHTIF